MRRVEQYQLWEEGKEERDFSPNRQLDGLALQKLCEQTSFLSYELLRWNEKNVEPLMDAGQLAKEDMEADEATG